MLAYLAMMVRSEPDLARWASETLQVIRRDYYMPKRKLYSERADRKAPCFNWGTGVMLPALNAAARHDKKYVPWLREYADASRVYWNKGGYDVLPGPKPLDRYYDDNAWMALALIETNEVLGDKKYLDWAAETVEFCLKGLAPDGGVFWRESDRASRNTCACAPTAAACLALWEHTKEPRLREQARSIYEWTRSHLQDPDDGLFWDNLRNDGHLDKTKWTYNTALMIRTAWDLGEKEEARRMLAAAEKRWLKNGRLDDSARFAHLLLEAGVRVRGDADADAAVLKSVYEARSGKGWVPGHWGDLKVGKNPELLDLASFVRASFIAAGKG